ncbi:MAG TPA: amidohydrolase family protein [Acidimicrobiales bacterium]|jgi:N-acyl-D-aspartate/D-glutamate deacylase|nr:amidohydrolase family protein [Acidimicrobiales bacterium]
MDYDLVIRNGTVVDGTGFAPYRADVGVKDGLIARIGRIDDTTARDIDADGHVVAPGFIDLHTHMDAQIFWDQLGSNSCYHGITSVVMGNCGFTLAPAPVEQRHLVVRNLERAEDISGAAMAAGIDWTWSSFAEYLDAVDRLPKAINYAANIGHSALRTFVMGERAFDGPATDEQIAAMDRELRDALHAGAIGFTTSRSDQHETSDNRPVASRLAAWQEVQRLVGTLGQLGAGVFQLTSEPAAQSNDDDIRNEYFSRLRALALDTRVPMTFGVLGTTGGLRVLDLIDSVSNEGGQMFGLAHSRGIAVLTSFRTRLAFDVLPEWKELRSLPLDEQHKALRDPAVRERLIHAAHHGDYGRPLGAEARKPDYEIMYVLERPVPPNPSVAEIAAQRGIDPVEAIIDLALETDLGQFFMQPVTRYEDSALKATMKHPRTVMTFSDSGAHVSQIADCSIQTHLLAHWVRDRQEFTLEEAVRMLTLAPARAWGFHDRGLVREGLVADINVFDPATVAPRMPTIVHDLPGGARRLEQRADGFLATLVGGEPILQSGEPTGACPGRLVRGPLAR